MILSTGQLRDAFISVPFPVNPVGTLFCSSLYIAKLKWDGNLLIWQLYKFLLLV